MTLQNKTSFIHSKFLPQKQENQIVSIWSKAQLKKAQQKKKKMKHGISLTIIIIKKKINYIKVFTTKKMFSSKLKNAMF